MYKYERRYEIQAEPAELKATGTRHRPASSCAAGATALNAALEHGPARVGRETVIAPILAPRPNRQVSSGHGADTACVRVGALPESAGTGSVHGIILAVLVCGCQRAATQTHREKTMSSIPATPLLYTSSFLFLTNIYSALLRTPTQGCCSPLMKLSKRICECEKGVWIVRLEVSDVHSVRSSQAGVARRMGWGGVDRWINCRGWWGG